MFKSNDMDDFWDLAKTLIKRGSSCQVVCSALQFSSSWQRPPSLTQEKEAANDAEVERVEVKEGEVFEVKRKPLIYTRAPTQKQLTPRSKRLNHRNVVEQAVCFWIK